jgi:CMP-N-acetylneuraminic acid synthetase
MGRSMNCIVALIPARGGSKRLPRKNIKRLGTHPLISYSIEVALQSKIFDGVYVSTDDLETEAIAQYYGATVIKRPKVLAKDDSPDIEWIKHALANIPKADHFMILRPTNPFRTIDMLWQAWNIYNLRADGTWLKGIQPVSEHPAKMWQVDEYDYTVMHTFCEDWWLHGYPTQTLPLYFIQNGSMEIRPTDNLEPLYMQPFITKGVEGYDINTEKDWIYALHLVVTGKVKLTEIDREPWVSPC